jgi:hypothetical protein
MPPDRGLVKKHPPQIEGDDPSSHRGTANRRRTVA